MDKELIKFRSLSSRLQEVVRTVVMVRRLKDRYMTNTSENVYKKSGRRENIKKANVEEVVELKCVG